jgi:uncharacterized protein (TIGR02271 family)
MHIWNTKKIMKKNNESDTENTNRVDDDGHPIATGVGALAGAGTGAAIGTAVGGPAGTVVGAVIGGVVGAFGGNAVGQAVDPEAEDAYWRNEHSKRPYGKHGKFEDFQPAYRTGYQGYDQHASEKKTFEDAEPDLRSEYEKSGANVPWDKARDASRDAWGRVESGEAVRVPVSEEQVKVGKRTVEQGGATIRKEVRTETVNTPVDLKREELVIERTDKTGGTVPGDAFNEGEIRIPLTKEEAVVQKEAKVVGEVKIGKREETERQNVSETVRKEEVKVDRTDVDRGNDNRRNR